MKNKLIQRTVTANGHVIDISLMGNLGSVNVTDNRIFPDEDGRAKRQELGYNTMLIGNMTRDDLKQLHTAIGEVLKYSK